MTSYVRQLLIRILLGALLYFVATGIACNDTMIESGMHYNFSNCAPRGNWIIAFPETATNVSIRIDDGLSIPTIASFNSISVTNVSISIRNVSCTVNATQKPQRNASLILLNFARSVIISNVSILLHSVIIVTDGVPIQLLAVEATIVRLLAIYINACTVIAPISSHLLTIAARCEASNVSIVVQATVLNLRTNVSAGLLEYSITPGGNTSHIAVEMRNCRIIFVRSKSGESSDLGLVVLHLCRQGATRGIAFFSHGSNWTVNDDVNLPSNPVRLAILWLQNTNGTVADSSYLANADSSIILFANSVIFMATSTHAVACDWQGMSLSNLNFAVSNVQINQRSAGPVGGSNSRQTFVFRSPQSWIENSSVAFSNVAAQQFIQSGYDVIDTAQFLSGLFSGVVGVYAARNVTIVFLNTTLHSEILNGTLLTGKEGVCLFGLVATLFSSDKLGNVDDSSIALINSSLTVRFGMLGAQGIIAGIVNTGAYLINCAGNASRLGITIVSSMLRAEFAQMNLPDSEQTFQKYSRNAVNVTSLITFSDVAPFLVRVIGEGAVASLPPFFLDRMKFTTYAKECVIRIRDSSIHRPTTTLTSEAQRPFDTPSLVSLSSNMSDTIVDVANVAIALNTSFAAFVCLASCRITGGRISVHQAVTIGTLFLHLTASDGFSFEGKTTQIFVSRCTLVGYQFPYLFYYHVGAPSGSLINVEMDVSIHKCVIRNFTQFVPPGALDALSVFTQSHIVFACNQWQMPKNFFDGQFLKEPLEIVRCTSTQSAPVVIPQTVPPPELVAVSGSMLMIGAAAGINSQVFIAVANFDCSHPSLRSSSRTAQLMLSPFYQQGNFAMVAGNVGLSLAVVVLHAAVVCCFYLCRSRKDWTASCEAAMFPGPSYFAVGFLLQGIARATFLSILQTADTTSLIVGAVIGIPYLVLLSMLWIRLQRRVVDKKMVFEIYKKRVLESNVVRYFTPCGRWGPANMRTMFGSFVGTVDSANRRLAALPHVAAVLINLIIALPLPSSLCALQWALLCLVPLGSVGIVVWRRPARIPCINTYNIIINATLVAAFVVSALSSSEAVNHASGVAIIAYLCISNSILSVLQVIHTLWATRWESQQQVTDVYIERTSSVSSHIGGANFESPRGASFALSSFADQQRVNFESSLSLLREVSPRMDGMHLQNCKTSPTFDNMQQLVVSAPLTTTALACSPQRYMPIVELARAAKVETSSRKSDQLHEADHYCVALLEECRAACPPPRSVRKVTSAEVQRNFMKFMQSPRSLEDRLVRLDLIVQSICVDKLIGKS